MIICIWDFFPIIRCKKLSFLDSCNLQSTCRFSCCLSESSCSTLLPIFPMSGNGWLVTFNYSAICCIFDHNLRPKVQFLKLFWLIPTFSCVSHESYPYETNETNFCNSIHRKHDLHMGLQSHNGILQLFYSNLSRKLMPPANMHFQEQNLSFFFTPEKKTMFLCITQQSWKWILLTDDRWSDIIIRDGLEFDTCGVSAIGIQRTIHLLARTY